MKKITGNEFWDLDPTFGVFSHLSEEEKARIESDPDYFDEIYADLEDEIHSGYLEDGYPFSRRLFSRCPCKDSWLALHVEKDENGEKETIWFDRSDPLWAEKMMSDAQYYSFRHYDVYFSPCPAGKKGKEGGIRQEDNVIVPALFLVIGTLEDETQKGKDLPATIDEAYAKLMALRSTPSIMVCSGYGMHAYWILSEPMRITNADELMEAKRFMRGFAEHIADELGYKDIDVHASEPSRLLRLPDTINWKRGRRADVYEYLSRTDI